ncbi:MAG TPA: M28 family peptidase [Flavobacterium sp.]|jgi:hypothetical protein
MKRKYASILPALFVVLILLVIYLTLMPQRVSGEKVSLDNFSTQRAMEKVRVISAQPHYVGSSNHKAVASYLEKELRQMGLETQRQTGTTLSDWGNLVKSTNIIARIKGTAPSKALVLLSHYDSAPHSASHGAADDASGVAVILESVRAFLHNRTPNKNDIIILFTDAEELGLNGAALFVTEHGWAKNVGLVLNFEARGTAGPGYMLMEVNQGNSAMVDAFADASPQYPVSNSLMYSIYKMLPNDTDLTVFREQGEIPGFNFAFIDDHFNYHTRQDDFSHLSEKSLAHQGSYLMPLLQHFANADLSNLNTADDQVYFNTPFFFFHYSFAWSFPLLAAAFLLFLFLVFVGLGKRILNTREIGQGFIVLFGSLLVCGAIGFLGWKGLLLLYPQYSEILQGFTYNGHAYIGGFISLALAILFLFYRNSATKILNVNHLVAPLLFWLLINLAIAVFLPGAAFFIIPVFFALIMFGFAIVTQRNSNVLNAILSIPALVIFTPFIVMFPIGLGLKILFGSMILTVLVFSLLLPVFGSFAKKALWSGFFFLLTIGFFIYAHLHSNYEPGKTRPNSLLYVYNADADKAVWTTYDRTLDDWTLTYLTDSPRKGQMLADMQLFSKYNTTFTFESDALVRALAEPIIGFTSDSTIGNRRHLTIKITPQRRVHRYDIFADEKTEFYDFTANGASALGQKGNLYPRKGKKLLSYYVVDNEPLELRFSVPANVKVDMDLLESSFDLMKNPLFEMKKRSATMMPMPFVLNDAVVIRKKIQPSAAAVPIAVRKNFTLQNRALADTIPDSDEPADIPEAE